MKKGTKTMKAKTTSIWNKYEFCIEDKKTESVLQDYIYAESIILAYDKANKLVETLNAKKDGRRWIVKFIGIIANADDHTMKIV